MSFKFNDEIGTNILYFTSKCNLACSYCYEKKDREKLEKLNKQFVISKEDIDDFFKNLIEREGLESQSNVVLFGGEPTLVFDLVEYAVQKGVSMKKNIFYNLTTNGLWMSKYDNFKRVKNLQSITENRLAVEISYDVSGNFLRVDKNGKSHLDKTLKAIELCEKENINYRIRYTVQPANYKNIKKDIAYLTIKYPNARRIVVSVAYSDLDKEDFFSKYQSKNKVQKPLCGLVCDVCDYCKPIEYTYYYAKDGKQLKVKKGTQKEFNHFTKEGNNAK